MTQDFHADNITVYPGELRGYRYWRTHPQIFDHRPSEDAGPKLYPTSCDVPWQEDTIASCCDLVGRRLTFYSSNQHPHPVCVAPCVDCGCGIYGFYRPDIAARDIGGYLVGFSAPMIFGVIAASGRIIPGTKGYRAQRARIVAVVNDEPLPHYPTVKVFTTRQGLLEAFPPQPLPLEKP